MRQKVCLFFPALLVAAISLPWLATANAEDLFPDKNLEAVVRTQVFAKRDNTQPLTADDVKNVSTVVGKNAEINNLKGLEACVSLALLDLEGNQITDLTPLKDLSALQSLNVAKNQVADVSPLADATSLQYLHLADNKINDIAPLAKLENLTSLYLSGNQLKSIAPVANLKKLWSLYIDGNPVADLTPVAGLNRLTTLDARGCQIENLAPLKGLNQWQFLMLDENKLADLGVLVEMAEKDAAGDMRFAPFWRVYLSGNPLSDTAKNEQIPKLKELGGKVFVE